MTAYTLARKMTSKSHSHHKILIILHNPIRLYGYTATKRTDLLYRKTVLFCWPGVYLYVMPVSPAGKKHTHCKTPPQAIPALVVILSQSGRIRKHLLKIIRNSKFP